MFKIGEFSRLTRVPIKTLRYYDEIGLFQPAQTDSFTGYRCYAVDQLPRLNRILALKELGFTLDQIREALDTSLTPDAMRGMLRLRQAQLEQQMQNTADRLAQVEIRLRQLEQEHTIMVDILIKQVTPLTIVGAREIVPTPEQMRDRCMALNNRAASFIQRRKLQTDWVSLALYYDNQHGIDVEMAYGLQTLIGEPPLEEGVQIHTLPAVTVAYAIYQGSYDDFGAVGQLHGTIHTWVDANGYRMTGASREFYLRPPQNSNDPQGVMEIQYPVEKV